MSLEFVGNFTQEELSQLFQAFNEGDTNHDGFLDYDEFFKVLSPYTLVEEQLKSLFKAFDINQDNKVNLKEFVTALAVSIKGTPQQKLEAIFKMYDVDGNNVLQGEEVTTVLTHLKTACDKIMENFPDQGVTNNFANAVISKLDLNKDGKITLEEWIAGGISTPQLLGLLGINV